MIIPDAFQRHRAFDVFLLCLRAYLLEKRACGIYVDRPVLADSLSGSRPEYLVIVRAAGEESDCRRQHLAGVGIDRLAVHLEDRLVAFYRGNDNCSLRQGRACSAIVQELEVAYSERLAGDVSVAVGFEDGHFSR